MNQIPQNVPPPAGTVHGIQIGAQHPFASIVLKLETSGKKKGSRSEIFCLASMVVKKQCPGSLLSASNMGMWWFAQFIDFGFRCLRGVVLESRDLHFRVDSYTTSHAKNLKSVLLPKIHAHLSGMLGRHLGHCF